MSRGHLVVISAPSGAGKTTICRRLQTSHPEWRFSVSATTRPRRPNETNGEDYTFLTEEQFDAYISAGELVEWEWIYGHRYGTLHSTLVEALEGGEALLLDVDVKGGVRVKGRFPEDTTAIFIDPPSMETLIERLKKRGTESPETLKKRLDRIPEELAYKKDYDHIVVNDDLDRAVNEIETIIMEVQ
ncbi:MAG: guanylate kinase [Fidelibacterota bacterium]|nr:MAG: guanylate kinase [Candidatus Neomarinimicrobiota bacterium]